MRKHLGLKLSSVLAVLATLYMLGAGTYYLHRFSIYRELDLQMHMVELQLRGVTIQEETARHELQ